MIGTSTKKKLVGIRHVRCVGFGTCGVGEVILVEEI